MAIATGDVYAKQNIETVPNQSSVLSHHPSVEQFSDVLALLINNTSSQNFSRLQKLSLACRYSQLTSDEIYQFEQGLFAAVIAKIILQVNFNGDSTDKKQTQFEDIYINDCQFILTKAGIEVDKSPLKPQLTDHAKFLLELAVTYAQTSPPKPYRYFPQSIWRYYYSYKSEPEKALKHARTAFSLIHPDDDLIGLVNLHNEFGFTLQRLGKLQEGLQSYRKGLALAKATQSEDILTYSYISLAHAYRKMGDYDTARRYFETAADEVFAKQSVEFNRGKQCVQNPQTHDVIYSLLVQLAIVDRLQGFYINALNKLSCATNWAGKSHYKNLIDREKAKILVATGQYNKAKSLLEDLLSRPKLLQGDILQGILLLLEIGLHEEKPRFRQEFVQQISNILTSQGDVIKYPADAIAFARLKMRYGALISDKTIFEQGAKLGFNLIEQISQDVANKQTWLAAQYAFIAEYVSSQYTQPSLRTEDFFLSSIEVLDSYYSLNYFQEYKKYAVGSAGDKMPDKLRQLWDVRLNAENSLIHANNKERINKHQALDVAQDIALAYQANQVDGEQTQKVNRLANYGLEKIQSLLASDEMLVRYFVHDEQSLAFVLTHDGTYIKTLPPVAQLRKSIANIRKYEGQQKMIDAIADSTLKALLPELFLADEKFTKLVIIPDDVLHQLPFSAIDIAKSNQFYRPLGKQKEIVRTHSIYDYLFLNSQSHRENIASDHIAVFANPVFEQPAIDLGMKPLDSSVKVVTSIKQHLNGEDLDIYIGKKATNHSLMNDQVRQAKLLHIASHGIYDKQTGIVGIATSVDEQSHIPSQGFLSLTHLMSRPFYSDLVVISGCETMLGKYYKGSGLNSMTRGFLSQGAGAVVGSLWKVPNNATVVFMEVFYRALSENNGDVSMALSKAKKHFIRHKNLRYRDPFYWAGFVLTTVNRSYEQISLNTKH